VIPPTLHPERNRILKPLPQLHPRSLLGQKSNRVDSVKSKMAFIGKSAWIVKPTGGMESTTKPKAISHSKRGVFLSKIDPQKAVHGDGAVRQNDLL